MRKLLSVTMIYLKTGRIVL
ncbi:unnamed protein product [Larinioides sclopetarius]|uniref:Uncharacterized protein n=1 Tax=Larinioides sclopetarius TaxID=280406 RepID=A0AAV2AUJ1_9ARAC